MKIDISLNKVELGRRAGKKGAELIRNAIAQNGHANIIVATGASQFEMLEVLVKEPGIDWGKVTAFHLDEYVNMPETHPASFRKYLRERFLEQLPTGVKAFHGVNGVGDTKAECARLLALLTASPIDVAFVGIGENGHLAFNDPPADFETEEAFIVVDLDDACRRQQLGEGWFASFDEVPTKALSMTIRQIMKSRAIIVSVPDKRKAEAVKTSVESEVSPMAPASILQQHCETYLYLDTESAVLLK